MVELHTLGRLELTGPDGRPVRSVLAQPRRFAVLAYLAVEGATRSVPREELLKVLWPDFGDERAKNGLRQALHFLRQALGREAIVSREDGALALNPAALAADVTAFEKACAEEEWESAVGLYRGELLPGFYLEDFSTFEHWLDVQRERLRRKATSAAWAASDEVNEEDKDGLAVHHALYAVELSPYSEDDALRLAALLERLGQYGEAAGALDSYAARISADLELEPSKTVENKRSELRSKVAEQPAEVTTPDLHPAPGGGESRSGPGSGSRSQTQIAPSPRLKVRSWIAAAAAVLALVYVGTKLTPASPPPAAASSSNAVAVLPFTYNGDGDLEFLADGVVSLIGVGLSGAGNLQAVDARAVLSASDRPPGDPNTAAALAADLGATSWITGQIVEGAGSVHISATLHRTPTAETVETFREGPPERALDLVGEITVSLMESMLGSDFGRRGVAITRSVPAARSFAAGEAAYRQGRYIEASARFREAVESDTTFALAYYRLSLAVSNAGAPGAREAIDRALQLSPNLVPLDSALLATWDMQRTGSILEAERGYRALVARRPTDVEAWFRLGELAFHWAGVVGIPARDIREAFGQVARLEPDNGNALFHAARAAGRDGDRLAFDSLASRLASLGSNPVWMRELQLAQAWMSEDAASTRDAEEWLLGRGQPQIANGFSAAITASGAVGPALRFLDTWRRQAPTSPYVPIWTAYMHAAAGRMGDAETALGEGALPPERVLEARAFLASVPGLDRDREELQALLEELEATPGSRMPPRTDRIWMGSIEAPPLAWGGFEFRHRHFLMAMLKLKLGNPALTQPHIEALDRTEGRGLLFARILRAHVALEAGDPQSGLAALGPPENPDPPVYEAFTDYARIHARFVRAMLLEALGRDTEALVWYETFPDFNGRDYPFVGPAELARGRILEAAGQPARAATHYGRAAALWREADPAIRRTGMAAESKSRALAGTGGADSAY